MISFRALGDRDGKPCKNTVGLSKCGYTKPFEMKISGDIFPIKTKLRHKISQHCC